jgi:hypothetical protein
MKDFLKKIIFMPDATPKKKTKKHCFSERAQIWGEGFSCDG